MAAGDRDIYKVSYWVISHSERLLEWFSWSLGDVKKFELGHTHPVVSMERVCQMVGGFRGKTPPHFKAARYS
jgi:hypothetical protein